MSGGRDSERAGHALLADRNIALIGFMTAGKTQVGAELSRMSGLPFMDIDLLVEHLEGAPIAHIFQVRGEPYFRQMESAVLRDLCSGSSRIIGCGGGTVLAEDNRRILRERCVSVWLRVSGETVLERLEMPGNPRRPLLEGLDASEVVPALLRAREAYYREASHTVDVDGRSVEEIAHEIAVRLGLPTFGR